MRIFLSTQVADEARHVAFFDRFYREVGVCEADGLRERLDATSEHLNDDFRKLFDEMLHDRVDRLAAEPGDMVALVEAITLYHLVIEGSLALTGQHFIIDYNEREGTLPAFVEGFTNVARDEHRHVAFGARFLRDMTRPCACSGPSRATRSSRRPRATSPRASSSPARTARRSAPRTSQDATSSAGSPRRPCSRAASCVAPAASTGC